VPYHLPVIIYLQCTPAASHLLVTEETTF